MTRRFAAGTLAALAITALSGADQPPRPPPTATGAVLIPPVEYTRTPFGVRADRGSPRSELIHVEPVSVPAEPTTTSTTATPAPVRARTVRRPPVTVPRRLTPPITVAEVVATSDSWGLPPLLRRIGGCESGGGPTGALNWTARNRSSGASGAFQILDSTFRSWEALYGDGRRYSRAMDAPPDFQVMLAVGAFRAQGTHPWAASAACWN